MAEQMQQGGGADLDAARKQAQELQQMFGAQGSDPVAMPDMAELGELASELGGARFRVRFAADAFGPGDTVDGTLVASESIKKAREIKAELRYVDESSDYVEGVTHATTGSLHQGPLESGVELPFTLRLPEDALPNWPGADGVVVEVQQGTMIRSDGPPGRLHWELVALVDVPRGRDIEEFTPVPLSGDASRWAGTALPPGEQSTKRVVKGWDVEIEPQRRALRRGEEIAAALTIGKPGADRTALRAGLVCDAVYDVETTSTDADGNTTTSRATRTTPVYEDWAEIDPAAPKQRLQLRVPEDAPFSYPRYKKAAFGLEWKLVAREDKRLRRDPRREAMIQVAP